MDEWQLLSRIERRVPKAGDDCAVVPWGNTHLLLTLDMLHRTADFPAGTTPYTIGWRSVAVSLSDLAAMGGSPLAVLLGLSVPEFDPAFADELLTGAQDCCRIAGGELAGGDLDSSQELFLSSCALGECPRPVLRKGARPGELVCVTGRLGATAQALHLMENGRMDEGNRLFRFTPRTAEGQKLVGIASSMVDISDGLAHSVHLLADASGVGFRIESKLIPWVAGLRSPALDYGEDFELLYTISEQDYRAELGMAIGRVTREGVYLSGPHEDQPLIDRGYNRGG
ncbi:MAG: thiamine-phosphate kinase [Candidatus Bipolaricaulota bacterium]